MQLAQVLGHATSTIKHPALNGWRMLVVQPLDVRGEADGTPVLAIDNLGGRTGERVILTSDGKGVREMMKSENTPVRWAVLGLTDENE